MKFPLTLLVASSLILSGCGWRDSRINPSNWGGGGETVPVDGTVNPLLPERSGSGLRRPPPEDVSVLIATVTDLRITPAPSGAVIVAEGVASRQGAYGAELRPVSEDLIDENGVLELEFRVAYPQSATPVGSERTRRVVNGYSLNTQQLAAIRLVRVRAAQNALESGRR
ncbi:hypothetical protein [Sedimentitalea arenosa]|jgi:hypothetical protein|uniref:Lipoprotein n=1 Tax=Sedimentitalea arenosa TaxID=2798803 RepID=A0A8J7IJL3_9RHOB|nr:hypothetical protein [Arenibacterium arenosum]MBJ6370713.1 hypothetical protein [Arenibacterium arenosum]